MVLVEGRVEKEDVGREDEEGGGRRPVPAAERYQRAGDHHGPVDEVHADAWERVEEVDRTVREVERRLNVVFADHPRHVQGRVDDDRQAEHDAEHRHAGGTDGPSAGVSDTSHVPTDEGCGGETRHGNIGRRSDVVSPLARRGHFAPTPKAETARLVRGHEPYATHPRPNTALERHSHSKSPDIWPRRSNGSWISSAPPPASDQPDAPHTQLRNAQFRVAVPAK